jgi:cobaltochelatase CobT
MTSGVPVGELLNLTLTLAFFGGMFWLWWRSSRRKRRSRDPVRDDPNQPYTVFTKEFDHELRAEEVERQLIGASPDYAQGWLKLGKDRWTSEIRLADELVEAQRAIFQRTLGDISELRGSALTFLIDQSGSMEGEPMRWTAVACRLAAEELERHGCHVEILGFSTAGWRGGFAYQKWQSSRRPKRPGRLCATLHIAYKELNERELKRESWEAMLNPNVLRENVDGEALEWAAKRLRQASANQKFLIVLSDGAPVDDATLMHNGLGYLVRHLRQVITDLEADASIKLSAVGIRHAVDEYYGRSVAVEDVTQLPVVVATWVTSLTHEINA